MTRRQVAWILIFIVDVGYIAWGAGAAASPLQLPGPGGRGILPAGYEGYTGTSELTEYFGLALVWRALAITAPFVPARRPLPVAG